MWADMIRIHCKTAAVDDLRGKITSRFHPVADGPLAIILRTIEHVQRGAPQGEATVLQTLQVQCLSVRVRKTAKHLLMDAIEQGSIIEGAVTLIELLRGVALLDLGSKVQAALGGSLGQSLIAAEGAGRHQGFTHSPADTNPSLASICHTIDDAMASTCARMLTASGMSRAV